MNLKLICAYLLGIGSIGGAVAGGMYFSKSATTKQENYSNTNTKPQPAKEAVPAPKNTVTEQTKPNAGQNTGSSGSSIVQGTPSSSGSTTSQVPLGG